MTPLTATDRLPLTCTRLGTCCHGYLIVLSPWEIAWLAQGMGISARHLRDTRMIAGGTQLRADGAIGVHGPAAHRGPACTLYDSDHGCRAHAHRPLACRLYPLGRERHQGAIRYYHPGTVMPCRELCPSVIDLPQRAVGDYLAEQDIAGGEAAHDGYAALAYGLVNAALVIADAGVLPRAVLAEEFATMRGWSADERAAHLGAEWYDALTIPDLPCSGDGGAFVAAHGQALSQRLQATFLALPAAGALGVAARLDLLLALHLGSTVGAQPAVMAALIAPTP